MVEQARERAVAGCTSGRDRRSSCRCLSSTSTTKLLTAKDILKAVKESELKYALEDGQDLGDELVGELMAKFDFLDGESDEDDAGD